MDRRLFGRAGLGIFAAVFAGAAEAESASDKQGAAGKTHRVVVQVTSDDRHVQALALGNTHNYAKYYKAKGEPFEIEVVAFGPGFSMIRGDMSMMKGEIENLLADVGAPLTILACENTRKAIAENEGKKPDDIPLLPGVKTTPSGIVRVAEAQEQGWSYVRP